MNAPTDIRTGPRRWLTTLALAILPVICLAAGGSKRPNVMLVMADDLGFGDVAFNGNPKVKTPVLDRLAQTGVRLNRFYSGGPVCTPTRGSAMTGRDPNRYGTTWAGRYPLPREEITLGEVLREAGYRTGFFGKWHLGKLTPKGDEGFPGARPEPHLYCAPWHQGFDTSFATESAVPNYNPEVWDLEWNLASTAPTANKFVMDRPIVHGEGTVVGKPLPRWPFRFWTGENKPAQETIAGDSSELIVNHAVRFVEQAVRQESPFLAVVWFVTAHTPVAAGPESRAQYAHLPMREQHWFGAISAMDAQIGRLLDTLRKLNVERDTLVWFCSDNGPSWVHELNSAGPLRGQKADLYEGGIRVPAVVSWPAGIRGGRTVELPISTHDFLPTVIAATKIAQPKLPVIDGENALPMLQGTATRRATPIYFDYPKRVATGTWVPGEARQMAVIEGEWKLVSVDNGASHQLYHLASDIAEKSDRAAERPEHVERMRAEWQRWREQCAASLKGADYR